MPESINAHEPPLNQGQREAIFDFLLLGMYADSVLKRVESARLYSLISSVGWESYQTPNEYANLATARVRDASENSGKTGVFLANLNDRLATPEARQFAMVLFLRLIESDKEINAEEDQLYTAAKAAFGV
ncbi:MAG: hypothetical protein EOP84_29785 [Verrucomicrobiaceae bacterium]|nr:MAG: hypothetical protein EOP84_29785 [Verrucomicrobiaceae bacterium]